MLFGVRFGQGEKRRYMRGRRFAPGRSLVGLVVCAITVVTAQVALTQGVQAVGERLVRPSQLSPGNPPSGSVALGRVGADRRIAFKVVLPPSDGGQLQSLLSNLYDPSSPEYHHWLAQGEFLSRFGPSSSEVAAVEGWLEGSGLTDIKLSGFAVDVSARASEVSKALGTSMEEYRAPTGNVGYLAQRAPLVPTALANGEIKAILGLNTLVRLQPQSSVVGSRSTATAGSTPRPNADEPTPCAAAESLAQEGSYTLDALGAAYGIGSLLADGQEGQGQTIGLYELSPHSASDVTTYESCFGLPDPVGTVAVDGGGSPSLTGTAEADADIEQVATQSPGASIISYEGPNSGTGPYDTWSAIVTADAAQVVSTSWGVCEPFARLAGQIPSFTTLFEQAATQGQTVLAAAGDSGSEDCYTTSGSTAEQVDYPASDAWVTAVGGTSLLGPGNEVTWNSCQDDESVSCANLSGGEAAGGGGLSRYEPKPSYQPEVLSWPVAQPCGTVCRQVPDVSANAGFPMVIYVGGSWTVGIGTSLAAPLIAGIVADKNYGCTTTAGVFTPALYALSSQGVYGTALNDIIGGDNDMTGSNGGAFPAGSGYDAATGLGSPIAGGLSCPEITSVQPAQAVAGSTVTLSGLGLERATVFFGGTSVQVTSASATQATVVVPSGTGSVTVSATSALGVGTTTSRFSYGTAGVNVERIFGVDAIGTSIAVSQAEFPVSGSAKAVVLARSDFFSDALAGGPLAAEVGGPLLITPGAPVSASLDSRVQAEIERVLPAGGTVYILGGPLALSPDIDSALQGIGYQTQRIAGADEYATAVDVAGQLGDPSTIFEATGLDFPDALSAVPAAIETRGAILLTDGTVQAPATASYLAAHPNDTRYAIGGPLASYGADPTAIPVYGQDFYGTSAAVASTFFATATTFGVATGVNFPDALSGGVFMGTLSARGPVLIVEPSGSLPPSVAGYLSGVESTLAQGYLFGGPLAVGAEVLSELESVG
jgi:hypothetical protein